MLYYIHKQESEKRNMDYSKWLTKVAKLRDPSFYEGERKRALDSILYDAEHHYVVATDSRVLLRINDNTITETHAYEPKIDVTSVGKDMPEYPMYERLLASLDSNHSVDSTAINTKIVKTKLKSIKDYKKAVKAKNDDSKSGFDYLTDMVKLVWTAGKLQILAHYDNIVEEPLLFEIDLSDNKRPDIDFTSHFAPSFIVLLLEFIADVQRADSTAKILISQHEELSPLIISSGDAMMAITPMRAI